MPRQSRPRGRVGPYDLDTVKLPMGNEFDALSMGLSRANIRRVVERSNQLLVQDTANAYIVLQPEINGPLARAVDMATLRTEFADDLKLGGLPDSLSNDQFKHQLDQKLSMKRGQSVIKGLASDHNWRPKRPNNRPGIQHLDCAIEAS